VEHGDMMSAYQRRLTSDDPEVRMAAAKAWSVWEGGTSYLLPEPDHEARNSVDEFAVAFARIENHYFVNGGFFEVDGQILREVDRIRHIPALISQGRDDMVCPIKTAWELHTAWPEADLRIVPDAGHSTKRDTSTSSFRRRTVSGPPGEHFGSMNDDGSIGPNANRTAVPPIHTRTRSAPLRSLGRTRMCARASRRWTHTRRTRSVRRPPREPARPIRCGGPHHLALDLGHELRGAGQCVVMTDDPPIGAGWQRATPHEDVVADPQEDIDRFRVIGDSDPHGHRGRFSHTAPSG
jgi:hypothetical protein